jgi:hypothetical protein
MHHLLPISVYEIIVKIFYHMILQSKNKHCKMAHSRCLMLHLRESTTILAACIIVTFQTRTNPILVSDYKLSPAVSSPDQHTSVHVS